MVGYITVKVQKIDKYLYCEYLGARAPLEQLYVKVKVKVKVKVIVKVKVQKVWNSMLQYLKGHSLTLQR